MKVVVHQQAKDGAIIEIGNLEIEDIRNELNIIVTPLLETKQNKVSCRLKFNFYQAVPVEEVN